jgi:hypothetical protein
MLKNSPTASDRGMENFEWPDQGCFKGAPEIGKSGLENGLDWVMGFKNMHRSINHRGADLC